MKHVANSHFSATKRFLWFATLLGSVICACFMLKSSIEGTFLFLDQFYQPTRIEILVIKGGADSLLR